jgi:3-oxoacyl-(acyl-carrier-protein) synthase
MENKVYVIAMAHDIPEEEYRNYVSPMKTRRYGKLLKRALVTALKCMKDSGIEHPDAVINGTALGSIEESEKILNGLVAEGEDVSMPTQFMLCTHNAVASLIGIFTHSHGYNNTYSQGKVSLECALLDAWMQLKTGMIRNALVCRNDLLTSDLKTKMEKIGMDTSQVKDGSLALMLSIEPGERPLYEIKNIDIMHRKGCKDVATIDYVSLCD